MTTFKKKIGTLNLKSGSSRKNQNVWPLHDKYFIISYIKNIFSVFFSFTSILFPQLRISFLDCKELVDRFVRRHFSSFSRFSTIASSIPLITLTENSQYQCNPGWIDSIDIFFPLRKKQGLQIQTFLIKKEKKLRFSLIFLSPSVR